jgi:hypothetical protein
MMEESLRTAIASVADGDFAKMAVLDGFPTVLARHVRLLLDACTEKDVVTVASLLDGIAEAADEKYSRIWTMLANAYSTAAQDENGVATAEIDALIRRLEPQKAILITKTYLARIRVGSRGSVGASDVGSVIHVLARLGEKLKKDAFNVRGSPVDLVLPGTEQDFMTFAHAVGVDGVLLPMLASEHQISTSVFWSDHHVFATGEADTRVRIAFSTRARLALTFPHEVEHVLAAKTEGSLEAAMLALALGVKNNVSGFDSLLADAALPTSNVSQITWSAVGQNQPNFLARGLVILALADAIKAPAYIPPANHWTTLVRGLDDALSDAVTLMIPDNKVAKERLAILLESSHGSLEAT